EYLRERNREAQRGIDEKAPMEFIPPKWQPLVCPQEGVIDRAVREICLLNELSQSLKSGNLHVPHSRAFQPVETYLIERQHWAQEKQNLASQLPLDYDQHWPRLQGLLHEQLRLLDEDYPGNPHLRLLDGELHIDRLEKLTPPDSARQLKSRVRQMLKRRHL